MELVSVVENIIIPAMNRLPMRMSSDAASVMLLAIGLQESKFEHRWQVLNDPTKKGPARSFWQGEETGGMVAGVMKHPATEQIARQLCVEDGVEFTTRAVWLAIEENDKLACCLARLLLWSDPRALPAPTDSDGAWSAYLRIWRPGQPHPQTWADNHARACQVLGLS